MKPTCKASLNTTELARSAKLNTDENDATIIDQAHSHIYVGSTYLSGRQVRPIKNNYLRMKKRYCPKKVCKGIKPDFSVGFRQR